MNTLSLAGIDVGSPGLSGSTQQRPNGFVITAGGADIWGEKDEFHFAQTRVTGDFGLSVRVESLAMADLYTKAGIMVRASLEGAAEHAYLLAFGDNQARNKNNGGLEFQYRQKADGPSVGIYPPQPLPVQPDFPVNFPRVWLRLSRTGATITGEYSNDGGNWKMFCTHQQRLLHTIYLGLAVTSHNPAKTVKAVFSDLKFSGKR